MRASESHQGGHSVGTSGGDGDLGNSCPVSHPSGGRLNLLFSYAGWQEQAWSDQLPRLLDPLGIRSHWASSGREATRVIQTTTIHVAVVDLGLPLETPGDEREAGARLLEVLSRLVPSPPTIVVKRGHTSREDLREMSAALRAGAFTAIDRPRSLGEVGLLLQALRRVLERHYGGRWPA
jgi:DNA-binding response OmpR family regulator